MYFYHDLAAQYSIAAEIAHSDPSKLRNPLKFPNQLIKSRKPQSQTQMAKKSKSKINDMLIFVTIQTLQNISSRIHSFHKND